MARIGGPPQPPRAAEWIPFGELTHRLQTETGGEILDRIVDQLEPYLAPMGMLEPGAFAPTTLARTRPLHRHFLEAAEEQFEPARNFRHMFPAVLSRVLDDCLDEGGQVSRSKVAEKLGPEGVELFDALARAEGPTPALGDRFSYDPLRTEDLARASTVIHPPEMKALEWAQSLAEPGAFEGMKFYGLQHLFLSSASLFEAIESLGVDPGDMYLQGKNYSTNFATAAYMEAKGARVNPASKKVCSAKNFEKVMEAAILQDLGELVAQIPASSLKDPKPEVLLIDDGGKAIELLHRDFPEYAPCFVCVEQTRRGARAVRDIPELKCPVINVAESVAKLESESPMIGHSVVLEVTKKLSNLEHAGVDLGRSSAVLGYGSVGAAVTKAMLERGFEVHVYDPDPIRRSLALREAEANGWGDRLVVHAELSDALPHAKTLVSCVGKPTLGPAQHAQLPDGAVLVNAASSNDELDPDSLMPFAVTQGVQDTGGRTWTRFQDNVICMGHANAEAHSSHVTRLPSGKEFLLVNGGYVVNMTGERDPIPPRYIQLTRTLLFLGALSAKDQFGKPGLHDVPKALQKELVDRVQTELAQTNESLYAPDWELHDPQSREPPHRPSPAVMQALGLNLERSYPEDTIFGYRLGRTEAGTVEHTANVNYGPGDQNVTLSQVVMHRLSSDLERYLPRIGFALRLKQDSGISEADLSKADPDLVRGHFAELYSRYLLVALDYFASSQRTTLDSEQTSKLLTRFLAEASMDAIPVLESLQRNPDAKVRRLAQSAYRALRAKPAVAVPVQTTRVA